MCGICWLRYCHKNWECMSSLITHSCLWFVIHSITDFFDSVHFCVHCSWSIIMVLLLVVVLSTVISETNIWVNRFICMFAPDSNPVGYLVVFTYQAWIQIQPDQYVDTFWISAPLFIWSTLHIFVFNRSLISLSYSHSVECLWWRCTLILVQSFSSCSVKMTSWYWSSRPFLKCGWRAWRECLTRPTWLFSSPTAASYLAVSSMLFSRYVLAIFRSAQGSKWKVIFSL